MSDNTILTDTYGPNAPTAAKFDQGARTVGRGSKSGRRAQRSLARASTAPRQPLSNAGRWSNGGRQPVRSVESHLD